MLSSHAHYTNGLTHTDQATGKKKKTVRQRNLPEDLRERGVAVIRPEGQNSSRVREGERSQLQRGKGVFFFV